MLQVRLHSLSTLYHPLHSSVSLPSLLKTVRMLVMTTGRTTEQVWFISTPSDINCAPTIHHLGESSILQNAQLRGAIKIFILEAGRNQGENYVAQDHVDKWWSPVFLAQALHYYGGWRGGGCL